MQSFSIGIWLRVLCCCILLSFVACEEQVVLEGLSQRQSIESLVVLRKAGVQARREKLAQGQDLSYQLLVQEDEYDRAVEILHDIGFPGDEKASAEELTRQKGFVPNSQELAKLRLDLAIASQIERALRSLPGVVDAKVIVRSGGDQDSSKGTRRASVILRYLSVSGKLPFDPAEVKSLVSNSVEGLRSEDVLLTSSRILLPTNDPFLGLDRGNDSGVVPLTRLTPFEIQVPEHQYGSAKKQILFVLLAGILSALFIGTFIGLEMQRRRSLRRSRKASGGAAFGQARLPSRGGRSEPSGLPQVSKSDSDRTSREVR